MAGCAIFELCAKRVNENDDHCQCQHSRKEDIGKVISIVGILVSNLMDIDIDRTYSAHDCILIDTLRSQYLALHGSVRKVYHCQNVLV